MCTPRVIFAAASGLLLAVYCGTSMAGICRVTTAGTNANDGVTWDSPMDLQTALHTAACTEVWVAGGTYTPTNDLIPSISFLVAPGVGAYGGFAGTESERAQRNPSLNISRLSGYIDQGGGFTTHSYHVVNMRGPISASTVLDGFTISDAYGPGEGGGLLCYGYGMGNECSPTLANLIFENNYGSCGGGLANDGSTGGISSPHLTNVTFRDNFAVDSGGGMCNLGGNGGHSNPVLTGVTFSGNTSSSNIAGGSGAPCSTQQAVRC